MKEKSQNHIFEFSKQATSYENYNIIQKEVAKHLINGITNEPKNILDLGCGSGTVFKNISWKINHFVGIDKSKEMCNLHPTNKNITIINSDFENLSTLSLKKDFFDIVIASSSLQWSKNLDNLFYSLKSYTTNIAFAIFCDGTFETIYKYTKLETFLPNIDDLLSLLNRYFNFKYNKRIYKLYFPNNISKFRYIKKSGVSGGKKKLSYIQTKKLIKNYPNDYLEFEVLFVWGSVK